MADQGIDLTGKDRAYAVRKFASHKAWKTRLVTAVTRSSNLLSNSYHWDTLQTLKKDLITLNRHMDILRHVAQWLEDEGYDATHTFMDDLGVIETEIARVTGLCGEVIHASRPTPPPVPQQPAAAAPHAPGAAEFAMKIAGTIKPEKLRASDTPAQFRSWEGKLESYFQAGGIDKIGVAAQHAVVRALIDVELEQTIAHRLDPTLPVFADS